MASGKKGKGFRGALQLAGTVRIISCPELPPRREESCPPKGATGNIAISSAMAGALSLRKCNSLHRPLLAEAEADSPYSIGGMQQMLPLSSTRSRVLDHMLLVGLRRLPGSCLFANATA